MKSIQNKQTDIDKQEVSETGEKHTVKCDYAGLITIAIGFPKVGGFDYKDIENRSEIAKAVKLAEEKTGEPESLNIEMENSYFDYLKTLIKDTKWPFWHMDLIAFKNDISAVK